ncbi:transcriptional regulator, TetR family [Solimonas aquatica]|uniref:Transcriptional regulator, TetR family n=1 Tax=Solimonas aquatica TaxID=489703 RepID=A0A1H8ZKT7_9GAMM|nr:TetR/AcrR family transcriptional regulator [Solimonas aquatica]SEP64974.1 transcriptional regulator, TetR family [Solimonas aquatica]
MPRKPAHEQFDTQKVIEEQAFSLFGRFGYEGVSIGDIAKAARLSKGALYWHFSGKDALYLSCLQQLHAIFEQYVFTPMRSETDPVRGVLHVFTGLQTLMQDPRIGKGVAGYWLIPSRPETAPLMAAQRAFEQNCIETLSATLARAQQQGQFDIAGEVEPMARAIIALIEACVVPMRQYTPEEMRGILAALARTLFRAYARSEELLALARSV